MIPNLEVWRPADKVETAAAWADAIERRDGPSALVLTRQGLAHQPRDAEQLACIRRGGYILREAGNGPDLILIATGSEVELAVNAAEELAERGIAARVVSMPNPERFLAQEAEYKASVLPDGVTARIAIEAGVTAYWHRFVGPHGAIIGIDRFGASAPAPELFEAFGLTVERIVDTAIELAGSASR